jgi:hypothetical protein
MKRIFKYLPGVLAVFFIGNSCTNTTYTLGDLTPPSGIVITAEIVGATTSSPAGDGSGDVKITITAKDALSYKVDYDANTPLELVYLPTGSTTKKYTTLGTNTYRITAVVFGKGGTSSTLTKDVTVRSDFTVAPAIVSNLTNGTSKTWVVDQSVAGHFGVGPWSNSSAGPEWWAAGVNEKVNCCNCFYTSTFTFAKNAATGTYSLQVKSPDGAFTKTGSLTTLPGIPGSGDEGCYSYTGGTSAFTFGPSTTGIAASAPSTKTAIMLNGNSTFIGYGALQKEYEIMVLTSTYMYLRVQGTETGNAWYIKLKPL